METGRSAIRGRPSVRPSLLSPFRSHSKFNTSSRINQASQVILKTSQNTVENFGLPLPVLVTETLTFADSNLQITARLSPDGWGWVVCGRRLLVWQYRDKRPRGAPSTPTTIAPVTCYELTLPQTDLAHKANLVAVFNTEGNQIPSCIGVSPEGVVRYWHSIAHEGGYIEKTADLHGQESDTLVDVNPVGCVLTTTTCTVVLIQFNISGGRHNIMTRTLQGSNGWFGGFGRRVSSLFFSALPAHTSSETRLIGVTKLDDPRNDEGVRICVVAGLCAQVWQLGSNERLTAEIDLQKILRDAFSQTSMIPPGDPSSLDVQICDLQPWNGGLMLYVAAMNIVRSPQTRYALAHMCVDEEGGIGRLLSFIPLQTGVGSTTRSNPQDGHLVATSSTALLYDRSKIVIASCVTPNDKPDKIELNLNNDQILGAGLCYGIPLFFSKAHGVISVVSNEKIHDISLCDSPIASPHPSDAFDGHLSLYEIDPKAVVEASEMAGQGSTIELFKAAFLHHTRREQNQSRIIINGLFPPGEEINVVNSPLDRTVLTIATNLMNDVPTSDPRWSQVNTGSTGAALGSSNSMQIGLQLQDKRKAFSLFLEFLRASGLWARLGGASPSGAVPAPTILLLRGLAEQLTAAITLRSLQQQTQHQHIIDTAIQQVISNSEDDEISETGSALSPSDLFYKNVSKIERALIQAVNWCSDQDTSGCAPPALSQLITKINTMITTVLQEVLKYRHQHADFYAIPPQALKLQLSHTIWSSSPDAGKLLSALRSQQALTISRARRAPIELRGELKSQATALASAALEFTRERVEGFPIDNKRREPLMKEYAQMRTEMIRPLVDSEEYEHASSLGEKFHDFEILVSICEKTNNREKLYQYMNRFENYGFQQCAFRWFVKRGRGGQAALLKAFPHHGVALSQWLAEQGMESRTDEVDQMLTDEEDTPENQVEGTTNTVDGAELLWLHELRADRWLQAANTLIQLSESESESVNRMTIQASLSKLCAYAANDETNVLKNASEDIIGNTNYRLLLAAHHTLPPELISVHGLDPDNLRVMEPRDIVDMFVTYNGNGLTEYDYTRALELCELIGNGENNITPKDINELRRRVWCATILVDNWDTYDKDSPITTIQNKMFFKAVNAVHLMDCNLDDYLIPLKELLKSKELKNLVNNKIFEYLMKMGYEHFCHFEDESMMVL